MTKNGFSKQFKDIQKDRAGVVQSSVYPGIKELVSEIYPEEAHFIYELLQNAEDAKASSVYFEIKKDMLLFRHNGTKLFDADDVDSITNIAKSTKKENYVQAGKFGIGFKSVYAFTENPSIYCDSVCFRIDQLLLPVLIDDIKERKEGWTEFRFPFNSPKISAMDAKKKIHQGLVEIESTTLLFLNNIDELDYVLEDGSEYRVIKEKTEQIITCLVLKNNNRIQQNSWMRFSRDSILNGKNTQVDIAFRIQCKDDEKSFDFIKGEDKVCIKFLAKNEKSNLRFFINAPFGCSPTRDTVNKGDRANNELIKEIALLIQTTITELRDKEYLTDDFFELLPLEDDNIPEFYQPLVKAIKKSFSDRKNLPTMTAGQYVTAENGIMSRRDVIDKIFTQKDIRILFQNNNLCFVKNRPINTRAYKFLKSLEIKELSPESVLVQMVNVGNRVLIDWLKLRKNESLLELYVFLNKGINNLERQAEKYEDYKDYANENSYLSYYASEEQKSLGNLYLELFEQIANVKKLPVIMTSDRDFVKASDAYIIEKGIEVPSEYKVVLRDLCKKDAAKRFLKSMGVKTFTKEELYGYQYKNEVASMKAYLDSLQNLEVLKKISPLEIVKKVLGFLEKHKAEELEWNKYRLIYAKNPERHASNWYRISECCLDKPLINETGLDAATSIHKKCVMDGIYNDLESQEKQKWVAFLKKSGVLWEIKVKYVRRKTGYVTGESYDYIIDNLKQYLGLHNIALARYIWKSLSTEDGWQSSYDTNYYKLNRNYSGRYDESTVLKVLKETKWVPDKNGTFRIPSDVSRDTIDTSFIIDESNGFLDAICFGANAKKQEEKKKAIEQRAFLKQEKQKQAARWLDFNSPEDVIASKEAARKVAELRELGIDIDDVISAEKKKKKENERMSIDAMMSSRRDERYIDGNRSDYDVVAMVSNPERRKKKLEEDLSEKSHDSKRKIKITDEEQINKEEKQFLYNQYSGKCQVCSKRIIKRDGSYYFEAINLLDTSKLDRKYLIGLNIGWNSLCLCPNCAAEYKHGAVSLYDFYERVKKVIIDKTIDDYIEFSIRMQGEKRELRYSPVHLFGLQTALSYFEIPSIADEEESSINNVLDKTQETIDATEIKRLQSGDRCPNCGVQNTHSSQVEVVDYKGDRRVIEGVVCKCGTIYLTRKLYNKIDNPDQYKIVKAEPPKSFKLEKKVNVKEGRVKSVLSKAGTHIVVNSVKKDASEMRCKKCKTIGTFMNTELCWDCYKYEQQSTFE